MARKQKDYLADLLADESAAPPPAASAPAPERPASVTIRPASSTLVNRQSALARIASGEVRQITQLQLDPARVRIWPGNPRFQARLSADNVRDLIDSILAEGGQKVPALVRRIDHESDFDYELIAGTRRHFAISWLRAHSYPDMKLLAQVVDLDDEAAFRFADIENRARTDISDIERARNYATALSTHYGGHQTRMAERLRLSKGWLSKLLRVATLPDSILAAFGSLTDLPLKPAYALAQVMDDPRRAAAAVQAAGEIAAVQQSLVAGGHPPLSGNEVLRRLTRAGQVEASPPTLFAAQSAIGRPALSVTGHNRQGLSLRLHAASGASETELVEMFREALRRHRIAGGAA